MKPEILDQNFSDLEAGFTYIATQCGEACDIIHINKEI